MIPPKGLHLARGREYVTGQIVGVSVAMGSVWAGLRYAPETMHSAARLIERQLQQGAGYADSPHLAQTARRYRNYGLMFGGGLVTSMGSQVVLARRRRERDAAYDDVSVQHDIQRVLTGWGIGALGAGAAVAIGDRYLRASSPKAISHVLTQAERALDKYLLGGAEFAPDNKISEGLVSNLVMIVGATPTSVLGQRLYEGLCGIDHAPGR